MSDDHGAPGPVPGADAPGGLPGGPPGPVPGPGAAESGPAAAAVPPVVRGPAGPPGPSAAAGAVGSDPAHDEGAASQPIAQPPASGRRGPRRLISRLRGRSTPAASSASAADPTGGDQPHPHHAHGTDHVPEHGAHGGHVPEHAARGGLIRRGVIAPIRAMAAAPSSEEEPIPASGPINPGAGEMLWGGESRALPRWVPRAVLAAVLGGGLFLVGRYVWSALAPLTTMFVVAMFLAFAVEPAVNKLAGIGMRRGLATLLVLFMATLGLIVVFVAFGALIVDQVLRIVDAAPAWLGSLAVWARDTFNVTIDVTSLQRELSNPQGALRTWLTGFAGTAVGGVVGLGASVVSAMFSGLTVGLFTFYLVADGPRFRRTVCSVLPPARQRVFLEVWTIAIDKTGGYLISRLLLAAISAAFHAVAFTWIELPNALVVGIFVGLVSQLVPTVGTYIAGLLPTLVALLDPQPSKALWVLGVVIIYQQVENYLLQPRITASTISIHPAVAFAAVIAGGALQGAIGALLALPAIATLQAILSTYLARHEVMESRLTAVADGPPAESRTGGSG